MPDVAPCRPEFSGEIRTRDGAERDFGLRDRRRRCAAGRSRPGPDQGCRLRHRLRRCAGGAGRLPGEADLAAYARAGDRRHGLGDRQRRRGPFGRRPCPGGGAGRLRRVRRRPARQRVRHSRQPRLRRCGEPAAQLPHRSARPARSRRPAEGRAPAGAGRSGRRRHRRRAGRQAFGRRGDRRGLDRGEAGLRASRRAPIESSTAPSRAGASG